MNRLSDAMLVQSRVMMEAPKKPALKPGMTQHEKARAWLEVNPTLAGLSQRAAAKAAGVSQPTLQRAMTERNDKNRYAKQERLFNAD